MWYARNDLFDGVIILKVCVESENCIGCGLCVSLCPDVFKMNDSGKSEVKTNELSALESEVEQCVESCPVNAIRIEE